MGRTISMSVDTTVDVDVDMDDFEDDELIEELEERGYRIYDPNDADDSFLNKEDCETILNRIGWDAKPGSELYAAIENLKNLYYQKRR